MTLDDPLPPEDWAGYAPGPDVEALYRDQGPRLARFFARRVAMDDVSDLVQETFRRLLGTISGTRVHLDNPNAYLHRVADNLLRDRARRPAQQIAHVAFEDDAIADPIPISSSKHATR